jgi:glycosyltransferase involved in cell wall biosynthesis
MTLSCIIPNYNHEKHLTERFNSILNQSFGNFECIYLDDNSTDSSNIVVGNYVNKDNRVSTYLNKINSGSTFYQWNKGVQYATGKFITIQESDDIANHNLFETLYSEIIKEEDIVLVFCQSYLIDSSSSLTGIWEYDSSDFEESFVMNGTDFIWKYLIHKNVIPNASAVMFRKDIYELVGGANPLFPSNGDWLLWLKLLCHGKVAFINNPLNKYRRHDNTVTFRFSQSNKLDYKEVYSSALRKEFNQYLERVKLKENLLIKNVNRKYISFDAGNYSLYLLENKKYLQSIKQLIVATFYGGFKSYYLKKFISDFNNRLFNKRFSTR